MYFIISYLVIRAEYWALHISKVAIAHKIIVVIITTSLQLVSNYIACIVHYLVQNEKGFRLYCRKILKLVIKNLLLVNKNAYRWYKIRISWFFYCLKKREFPRNNHNFQDIIKVLEFVNPTFYIFDIIVWFRLHCIWSLECLYFFSFRCTFTYTKIWIRKDLDFFVQIYFQLKIAFCQITFSNIQNNKNLIL